MGISNEDKLAMMKDRYNKLKENGKNIKAGGVLRKLERQIRNMEKN